MHYSKIEADLDKQRQLDTIALEKSQLKYALVGPPNSGKTTLFNLLTGMQYSTSNYPGATVEFCTGPLKGNPDIQVIDTPGVGSLLAFSPEEMVTVNCLQEYKPEKVIVVVDSNQLSRHLYIAHQLQFMGYEILLVVTMMDVAAKKGKEINLEKLSQFMDCDVIGLDPRNKENRQLVLEKLRQSHNKPFTATKTLNDLRGHYTHDSIQRIYEGLDDIEKLVTRQNEIKKVGSFVLDNIFLHPVMGVVSFALIMTFIFASIFWFAQPFMDGIDGFFGWAIEASKTVLPANWFGDFISDGMIAGVGAVAVFLPQIVILFMFMGILEDSGYLARGAAIIDKPLSKLGLNGKSFVPLLSGYACAIPAMMAARTIRNPLERKLTLFIIPLMSCSARLPVYVLLIGFLMPPGSAILAGAALAALYFGGFLMGAVVSTILSRMLKPDINSSFMQEIPPIRRPVFKIVLKTTYNRAKEYVIKAGPTILIISALLWVFTHTPAIGFDKNKILETSEENPSEYVAISNSLAAQIGQWIEPVTRPLGLDWRGGVALMSGFAAREVFVSSMALIYRLDDMEEEEGVNERLIKRMKGITFIGTDEKIFTLSTVLGMILFYMIALQCFPTVAVAKKEFGSKKLAFLQLAVFTGAAYILSLALVQGLRLFGIA